METKTSIIFKVQLDKGLWRKIRISDSSTLDDLSQAILDAYNFENDHLYGFFMDNRTWSDINAYWSADCDEPPYADERNLSYFNFQKGNKFVYIFDFGDEWTFQLTVVKTVDEDTPEPVIFDIKGEAPPQYEDWDEDDDGE